VQRSRFEVALVAQTSRSDLRTIHEVLTLGNMTTVANLVSLGAMVLLPIQLVAAQSFSVHLVSQYGPVVEGFVDPASDTFTITSWTNSSASVTNYWEPLPDQFPLVLNAVDTNGVSFDVPNNWDGTMSRNWAFVLPSGRDIVSGVKWKQGTPNVFWAGSSFGWGGMRNGLGQIIGNGDDFGVRRLRYVPRNANQLGDPPFQQVVIQPLTNQQPAVLNAVYSGVVFRGTVGTAYRVDSNDDLRNNGWTTLTNFILPMSPYFFPDLQATTAAQRFYRVVGIQAQ
jgi:hypothetical protein